MTDGALSWRKIASWLLGVAGVVAIVWMFRPEDFPGTIRSVGVQGFAAWLVLTIAARFVQGETTVVPVQALGFSLRRMEAFWIGWLRTFANQVLPLSGVAAYSHALRQRTRISWSELAALAAPQYVLAAAALGCIGLLAVACNPQLSGSVSLVLAAVYVSVLLASVGLVRGAAWLIESLPHALSSRIRRTSESLRKLVQEPGLVPRLILYHCAIVLLRGLRLWMLFAAIDVDLSWNEALLLIAIAESTLLIQLTPGGLGLREGAILGGAALLGIPVTLATSVALLDRLLVMALTALLTPPAMGVLKARRDADA